MKTAFASLVKCALTACLTVSLVACFGGGKGNGGSDQEGGAAAGSGNGNDTSSGQVNVIVEGLQGSGLVLKRNNEDSLNILKDGSYAFPSPLTVGTSFSISVFSQPSEPDQVCSVDQQEHTLRAGDEAISVKVSCLLSHSVGGAVSGLNGSGLLLLLNDTVPLTIEGNGQFTFAEQVASGQKYQVSLSKQPVFGTQVPSQTCTLENSSGTVSQQDVNDIQVYCIDDVHPQVRSTSPAAGDASAPLEGMISIVFDEDLLPTSINAGSVVLRDNQGQAVAGSVSLDDSMNSITFQSEDTLRLSSSYQIELARNITDLSGNPLTGEMTWSFATRDGSWKTPLLLETDDVGTVGRASVAMDKSGNAIAVWRQHDGIRYNIMANHFSSDTGWGEAVFVEQSDNGTSWDPKVAVDGDGNGIAVWTQLSGIKESVWANRYIPGKGWQTPVNIELDNTAGAASNPILAMNEDGQAVVLWQEFNGIFENIWGNTFDPETGWGVARMIELSIGDAKQQQVAVDADGNATAIWRQTYRDRIDLLTSYYNSELGTWSTPVTVVDGDAVINHPQVVMNQVGSAVFAWVQQEGTRDDIWVNRFHIETGMGSPELIETDNAGSADSVQLAVDFDGNAFAVWRQHDGKVYNIMANRYLISSGWEGAQLIESDDRGGAYSPQIDIDAGGNAMVVWYQLDGQYYNIVANRYRANIGWGWATVIDREYRGNAIDPDVTVGPVGNAIAVWRQWDGARNNIVANEFK